MCHLFSLTHIVKEPTHVHHDGSASLIDHVLFQILYCLILAMLFLLSLMQITRASMYKCLGDQQLSITVTTTIRAKLFGAIARLTGRKQVTVLTRIPYCLMISMRRGLIGPNSFYQ